MRRRLSALRARISPGARREVARIRALRRRAKPVLARPPYAGRHEGESALVLGNGPSLAEYRSEIYALSARERLLVLGTNHITPFIVPDYHAFTSRKRFVPCAHTLDPTRSRVLLSPYFSDELIAAHYAGPFERIAYVNDNEARFDIVDGIIQAGCRTSSVLLIGVAIVMGASRIYVAGLDGFRPIIEAPEIPVAQQQVYHADMPIFDHRADEYRRVDVYTRRFLAEIHDYLARAGREPFAIVTPTAYDEYYRPEALDRATGASAHTS